MRTSAASGLTSAIADFPSPRSEQGKHPVGLRVRSRRQTHRRMDRTRTRYPCVPARRTTARPAFPSSSRRRAGRQSASRRARQAPSSGARLPRCALGGLARARGAVRSASACLLTRRRSVTHRASAPRTGTSTAGSPPTGPPGRTEASLIGSIMAGGVVLPIVVGRDRARLRVFRKWRIAAFVVFALDRRVGGLPRHDARLPRAPAARRPAREPARERELPVRPHGGVDRRLRRPRAAAHVEVHEPRLPRRRVDRSPSRSRSSSRCRGCTAACTTRSTSTGGALLGIGALCVHRLRLPRRPVRRTRRGRRPDEGRRRRSFGQDARRRAARASPRCSRRGRRPTRSGSRCRRAGRRRPRSSARSTQGAELVFAWGGDGMVQRCVDVLAGSEASLAIIPAGTANLFASNLGIPKDIEQAVDARAPRRAPPPRRRPLQRRAVRRDGGRRASTRR